MKHLLPWQAAIKEMACVTCGVAAGVSCQLKYKGQERVVHVARIYAYRRKLGPEEFKKRHNVRPDQTTYTDLYGPTYANTHSDATH